MSYVEAILVLAAGLSFLLLTHPVAVVLGAVTRSNARRWNAKKIDEIAALPPEMRTAAIAGLSSLDRFMYYPEHSSPHLYMLRVMGLLAGIMGIIGLLGRISQS